MSTAAPKMKMNKTLITKAVLTVLIVLIAGYSQYKQEAENQESAQQSAIAALGAKLRSLEFSGKPLGRIITGGEEPLPKWIWVIASVMVLATVFRKQIEKAMENSK